MGARATRQLGGGYLERERPTFGDPTVHAGAHSSALARRRLLALVGAATTARATIAAAALDDHLYRRVVAKVLAQQLVKPWRQIPGTRQYATGRPFAPASAARGSLPPIVRRS
jgi:hypothetical protein